MLNKHGEGTIYFGVKNNGDVIGQKDLNENTLRGLYLSKMPAFLTKCNDIW